jgi:hypothetical protein
MMLGCQKVFDVLARQLWHGVCTKSQYEMVAHGLADHPRGRRLTPGRDIGLQPLLGVVPKQNGLRFLFQQSHVP